MSMLNQRRTFPLVGRIAVTALLAMWPFTELAAATPGLSANGSTACLLRADGSVSCWGVNVDGKATPPPGPFLEITVGTGAACGLRPDGTVECWGQGAASITPPPGSYTAIDAGRGLACGIRGDQTVVCAGTNVGQNWIPFTGENDRFRSVGVGLVQVCGVRIDGSLTCAGLQTPPPPPSGSFTRVFGDKTGNFTWCAIRADNQVICWGNSAHRRTQAPVGAFTSVGIGAYHVCGLRADQSIACWGYNGSQDYRQYFPPAGQFVSLGVDDVSNCAIDLNGRVQCWGADQAGEAPSLQIVPQRINASEVGTPYSTQLLAQDRGTNVTYSPYEPVDPLFDVIDGALPPGISMTEHGLVEGVATDEGAWPVTVLAQDANGMEVERALVFTTVQPGQDITPPVIQGSVRGVRQTVGWYNGGVTVDWSVNDPESAAISSVGCEPVLVDYDTPITGISFTCSARSTGGTHQESVEFRRDATPPVVLITSVAQVPGSPEYYRVEFTASDLLADLNQVECKLGDGSFSQCLTPDHHLAGPVGQGQEIFSVRAFDHAGNYSDPITVELRPQPPPDTTPPVIVANLDGPVGDNGWYRGAVRVSWSIADPESAVTSTVGCESREISSETSGTVLTCLATSLGGTGSQEVTVRIDATPPLVEIPALAPNYLLRAFVVPEFAASDTLSGLAMRSCDHLDTATVGYKTVGCTARDVAGNTQGATIAYSVYYGFAYTNVIQSDAQVGVVINQAPTKGNVQISWRMTDATGRAVTTLANAVLREDAGSCGPATSPIINPLLESKGPAKFTNHGNGDYSLSFKPSRAWLPSCRDQYIDVLDPAKRIFTIVYAKPR